MKQKIIENKNYTDNFVNKLFKENGNVFYISSSHSSFSRVWTYTSSDILIYYLECNKSILNKRVEVVNFLEKVPKDTFFETDVCLELDGELIGYKILQKGKLHEVELPISVNCLKNQNFKIEFLNNLVTHINDYGIWNVNQQTLPKFRTHPN